VTATAGRRHLRRLIRVRACRSRREIHVVTRRRGIVKQGRLTPDESKLPEPTVLEEKVEDRAVRYVINGS
jgi:hypothetical protein